jgi:hypothetical protein
MHNLSETLMILQRMRDECDTMQTQAAATAIFSAFDTCWPSSGLSEMLKNNARVDFVEVLKREKLDKYICHLFETYSEAMLNGATCSDSTILLDFSCLIANLFDVLPGAMKDCAKEDCQVQLAAILERIVTSFVASVEPQIQSLRLACDRILQICTARTDPQSHVFLLEFPIGNTIPTELVRRKLSRNGIRNSVISIALSRNDSKSKGITRRELLETAIKTHCVQHSSLIVLVDEWLSGSNFRGLTTAIAKSCKEHKASFIALGLLSSTASTNPRFASHCEAHDKLLNPAFAKFKNELRVTFPGLTSKFPRNAAFFWSECDRIAGCRKMELQSTYLQHIYRAAGSIATDSVVRAKAKSLFFTTVASKQQQFPDLPRLTPDVVYDNNTWNQEVDTSYQDLIACQSELEQRCDISLPQKESDVDQYIRDFVAIVHDVVDGRPAAQCLTLAEMLLESEGPQLLEDNYFLDDRPPMVIPLDGGFGLLNKVLLDQLWALM